ncbi:MAG TPA: hypothetical protein VNZ26_31695, partial [Vicinamibacterales bacterium]|nr:hypothetical protein [Vicinamibacterales bacterium]
MSRLSEALNRAVGKSDGVPTLNPAESGSSTASAVADVDHAWQFSVDEGTRDVAETVSEPQHSASLPTAMTSFPDEERQANPVPAPKPVRSFYYNFGEATKGKAVAGPDADGVLVEQYRRLGAVLHQAQVHSGVRTVMIASAVASEGKTLTATNVALTLSQSFQRRVLLIDADLR